MSALWGNASDTFSDDDDDAQPARGQPTPRGQVTRKQSYMGRHEFDDVSLRLHRLYRAATADEALAAAEDRFDEAAEMVVANTPSEIRQLGSCVACGWSSAFYSMAATSSPSPSSSAPSTNLR